MIFLRSKNEHQLKKIIVHFAQNIFFLLYAFFLFLFFSLFFGDYLKGKKAGKLYDEITDFDALQTVQDSMITYS